MTLTLSFRVLYENISESLSYNSLQERDYKYNEAVNVDCCSADGV